MDSNLRRGLLASFILAGAVAMIGTSQYIGIGLFLVAAIWWYLFWFSKSPVKKHCWSIPDKLMVITLEIPGYKATVRSKYISVWVDLASPSGIMVDKIGLSIERQESIISDEWKPHEVITREHKFLDFKRPDYLNTAGEYKARLIAYTSEGYSKSGVFILEVNERQPQPVVVV